MSDLSTISVMFEELKQILKRVESNSTKPDSSVTQDIISTSDLANITNQVSQSEELIIQKLEQLEQEVIDKARRIEQAKLKEEEAERLQNEASKLKSE